MAWSKTVFLGKLVWWEDAEVIATKHSFYFGIHSLTQACAIASNTQLYNYPNYNLHLHLIGGHVQHAKDMLVRDCAKIFMYYTAHTAHRNHFLRNKLVKLIGWGQGTLKQ